MAYLVRFHMAHESCFFGFALTGSAHGAGISWVKLMASSCWTRWGGYEYYRSRIVRWQIGNCGG
jgi:hypothetical protein